MFEEQLYSPTALAADTTSPTVSTPNTTSKETAASVSAQELVEHAKKAIKIMQENSKDLRTVDCKSFSPRDESERVMIENLQKLISEHLRRK